jgi:hypothetical protein
MTRLATVACDLCGWPIECLADARVQLITGTDDVEAVAVFLVHHTTARRKCTPYYERRVQLVDLAQRTGHLQDYPAAAFLDQQSAASLRNRQSSRHTWPFVRRLLMRIRRLDRRAALPAKKLATARRDIRERSRIVAAQSHGSPTAAAQ